MAFNRTYHARTKKAGDDFASLGEILTQALEAAPKRRKKRGARLQGVQLELFDRDPDHGSGGMHSSGGLVRVSEPLFDLFPEAFEE